MTIIYAIISSPWFGPIAGLITGYAFYKLSTSRKKPAFQQRGIRLLGHNEKVLPRDVEIRYGGSVVPRLTKTIIIFWNHGNATLDGKDIAENDKLRIEFDDETEILTIDIVKQSRPVINFRHEASAQKNLSIINFDFLDKNDGAIIEILHTSKSATAEIKGTIRGVPEGFEDFGLFFTPMSVKRRATPFAGSIQKVFGFTTFFLFALTMASIFGWFNHLNPTETSKLERVLMSSALAFAFLMSLFLLITVRRRHPKSLQFDGA